MEKKITVALAGNPNSGKTTVFNMLTGARQHTANYPGTTVEIKQGRCRHKGCEITVVDLPGTYSLTTYSTEELIARNFIIEQKPDVVMDIVDASNIERNLYLAVQLIETGAPLVLAFNMSDIAEQRGLVFDIDLLSKLLEAPIVQTVGNKGKGKIELLDAVIRTARQGKTQRTHRVNYGKEIEKELAGLELVLAENQPLLVQRYGSRWSAVKLLEQDSHVTARIDSHAVHDAANASISRLKTVFADEPEVVIADRRYGFISGACEEAVKSSAESRHTSSDIADLLILNRVLGLPIFLLLMYIVFKLTFLAAEPLTRVMESLFGGLSNLVASLWPGQVDSPVKSLLVDGVIGGVGSVLVFLPNILLLFLAIAILEDSGYMARAAFVMDRIMHKIGLHGKSFIPMLIGFGCSVPAIMATRMLENRRNRLTTMMVVPLMSCGARLSIYALIIPAFFPPKWHSLMLWLIYLVGITLAVVSAKILRITLFRGDTAPFVMELPPYRMPTATGLIIHMCERAWWYLKKAGTIILAVSVLLWAAARYPRPPAAGLAGLSKEQKQQALMSHSVVGRLGRLLEPVVQPLGFDWRIGTALIGALGAKELFVAQLGIVYSLGEADEQSEALRTKLQQHYSPLVGLCIMLFTLIGTPCVATLVICRRESGSWKWPLLQFFGLTGLAYAVTFVVYQLGSLLT
jgi:ferrous iron transport protein B